MHVSLGKQDPLPVRLLMVRVPSEVTKKRRERLSEQARDKGKVVSEQQWRLAEWTLVVTNAAAKHIGVEQALVLLRERWLIELWKSQGQIDAWRSQLPWQALCELYAKLIAVVLQHWLLLFGCWHDPWRSLVKASAVVSALALDLLEVLSGLSRLHPVVRTLRRRMQSGCRLNRRAAEPCLAQVLLEGLDWLLT